MKSCFMLLMLAGTLFLPLSAFTWKKKPAATVEGILGENITLEWEFSLVSANETLVNFVLLQDGKDMINYSPDAGVVIYRSFTGRVGLAANATPAFMLINLRQSDDKADFCCKVSTKRRQSSHGDLHDHCVKLELLVRPSIVKISRNQTLDESSDVTLSCNTTGTPLPNVTWSKAGDHTKFNPGPFLSLRNISRQQEGLYWCTAENGAGKATAAVRVTVQYAPSITAPAKSYNITEGSDIELVCTADGRPHPVVTWTKIGESSSAVYPDGQKLLITNANRTKAGTYKCTATNGIRKDATATIDVVIFFPPTIQFISRDTTVNETDDVKLFCNSTGKPHPNITWTFLKDPDTKLIETRETLNLFEVGRSQAGIYRCEASNGVMTPKTADVHLTINYKPEIKERGQGQMSSWINHETKVTCETEGVPTPDVTWTRNGIVVSSIQSKPGINELTLLPEDENDFGDYVCTAKNLLGTTKKVITIKELVAPEAPEILRIDPGVENMEIYWQAAISNPDSPVLDYLVKVKEKGESEHWRNCTEVQTTGNSLMCAVNDLRSGTEYIVQVAARNVVGFSAFTETEAQTSIPAVKGRADALKQELLPRGTIDGIIAGVICFCSLVVLIVAIVTQRRPCDIACKKDKRNKSSDDCNRGHDNPAMEMNPENDQVEEEV